MSTIKGDARVLFLKSKPGKPGGVTVTVDVPPEVRVALEDRINALNGKAVEVHLAGEADVISNEQAALIDMEAGLKAMANTLSGMLADVGVIMDSRHFSTGPKHLCPSSGVWGETGTDPQGINTTSGLQLPINRIIKAAIDLEPPNAPYFGNADFMALTWADIEGKHEEAMEETRKLGLAHGIQERIEGIQQLKGKAKTAARAKVEAVLEEINAPMKVWADAYEELGKEIRAEIRYRIEPHIFAGGEEEANGVALDLTEGVESYMKMNPEHPILGGIEDVIEAWKAEQREPALPLDTPAEGPEKPANCPGEYVPVGGVDCPCPGCDAPCESREEAL